MPKFTALMLQGDWYCIFVKRKGKPRPLAPSELLGICNQRDEALAACQAFVSAWEKSLQLEKTDVALAMAYAALENAKQ